MVLFLPQPESSSKARTAQSPRVSLPAHEASLTHADRANGRVRWRKIAPTCPTQVPAVPTPPRQDHSRHRSCPGQSLRFGRWAGAAACEILCPHSDVSSPFQAGTERELVVRSGSSQRPARREKAESAGHGARTPGPGWCPHSSFEEPGEGSVWMPQTVDATREPGPRGSCGHKMKQWGQGKMIRGGVRGGACRGIE